MNSEYIGDSVYVKDLGDKIEIYLDNGLGKYHSIFMNAIVLRNFMKFYERWRDSDE